MERVKAIRDLEKGILSDVSKANSIVVIRKQMTNVSEEVKVRLGALHSLRRIFTLILTENVYQAPDSPSPQQAEHWKMLSEWVGAQLDSYKLALCSLIACGEGLEEIETSAVKTLMEFVRIEHNTTAEWRAAAGVAQGSYNFGFETFRRLIVAMVCTRKEIDVDLLLMLKDEVFSSLDCEFFTTRILREIIDEVKAAVLRSGSGTSTAAAATRLELAEYYTRAISQPQQPPQQPLQQGEGEEQGRVLESAAAISMLAVTDVTRNLLDIMRVLTPPDAELDSECGAPDGSGMVAKGMQEELYFVHPVRSKHAGLGARGDEAGALSGSDGEEEEDNEGDAAYNDSFTSATLEKERKALEKSRSKQQRETPSSVQRKEADMALLAELAGMSKQKFGTQLAKRGRPQREPSEDFPSLLKKRKQGSKRGTAGGKGLSVCEQLLHLPTHRKSFSKMWISFLSLPLTSQQHRLVLRHLAEHVLCVSVTGAGSGGAGAVCKLTNPLLLADYLTVSYNQGGVVAVLALESLFHLILQYNLDYPDFFLSLYRLCTVEVFCAKYRNKFMRLLNASLKSTNIPAYLVAAFAKRLCFLGLHTTSLNAHYCLSQATWLLQRHPQCQRLIHRSAAGEGVGKGKGNSEGVVSDVLSTFADLSRSEYDALHVEDTSASSTSSSSSSSTVTTVISASETGASKIHAALTSSLWEAELLTAHHMHTVATVAKTLRDDAATTAAGAQAKYIPVEEFLELAYGELIEAELAKKVKKNAALAYRLPSGLFASAGSAAGIINMGGVRGTTGVGVGEASVIGGLFGSSSAR